MVEAVGATDDVGEAKRVLRRRFREHRNALPLAYRRHCSERIADKLLDVIQRRGVRCVSLYFPIGSEVDVLPVADRLLAQGIAVALPCVRSDCGLDLRLVENLADCKPVGALNIPEPIPEQCPLLAPDDLDMAVVPGVAWDIDGYRIGYGKGCYDRLLAALPARVLRVGVAYDEQVVRAVPRQSFDQPVHELATAKEWYCPRAEIWHSRSPEETFAIGRRLGERLAVEGGVVGLVGPLGAGKTRLAAGIACGMGLQANMESPSYTLAARYGDRLSHVDLYRLDPQRCDDSDVFSLEEEIQATHCTLVEWADRAWDWIPLHASILSIQFAGGHERQLRYLSYRQVVESGE